MFILFLLTGNCCVCIYMFCFSRLRLNFFPFWRLCPYLKGHWSFRLRNFYNNNKKTIKKRFWLIKKLKERTSMLAFSVVLKMLLTLSLVYKGTQTMMRNLCAKIWILCMPLNLDFEVVASKCGSKRASWLDKLVLEIMDAVISLFNIFNLPFKFVSPGRIG